MNDELGTRAEIGFAFVITRVRVSLSETEWE